MSIDPQLFERASHAFNTINITRGQVVSIATCDPTGFPNVAPIGSLRVVDCNTVHVLQGFLPHTLRNLEANPRAAFSITLRSSVLSDLVGMLRRGPDAPLGYRIYGELVGINADRDVVREEAREIVRRAPLFLRKAFAGFCEKNLRRLLKFQITDIRAT